MVMWVLIMNKSPAQRSDNYLTGRIIDTTGERINGATIALHQSIDSVILRYGITDGDGIFSFGRLQPGSFFLQISHAGYYTQRAPVNLIAGDTLNIMPDITLRKTHVSLLEVVVKASKPVIEVRSDRIVFNVGASNAGTGNNVMELLQKSPAVSVDNNDNISINGKAGVNIYIDGRPTYLSGTDISSYLRTLQASDVELIEIITNPSSQFDAAGTAGIINIKMKRDTKLGTNATVSGGYNTGIYAKYNSTLSMNHRGKNANIFGAYNNNFGISRTFFNLYRLQLDSIFDQKSFTLTDNFAHNLKGGIDWFITKDKTIGFVLDAGIATSGGVTNSRTPISSAITDQTGRILFAESNQQADRNRFGANINYKVSNNKGKDFNIDGDYAFFGNTFNSFQPNYYTDASGQVKLSEVNFRIYTDTKIRVGAIKTDKEFPYKGGKLSVGAKISYVKTHNDFQFFDIGSLGEIYNDLRSRLFVYKENINAAYVHFKKQHKNVEWQLGLRSEHTNSQGKLTSTQLAVNNDIKRSYIDLFPSGGVQVQLSKISSAGITFSRRIDRPAYQTLNPFENRLDELTYQRGYPFLKPQYTNSVEISYVPIKGLSFRLSYSHIKDFFAQIKDTVEGIRNFITPANLQQNIVWFLGVTHSHNFTKWWGGFTSSGISHTRFNGDVGRSGTIDLDAIVFNIYTEQRFSLLKDLSFRLSGSYRSPSIWSGTYRSDPYWFVDAGFRQNMFKGMGTLQVTISDIFFSARYRSVGRFTGIVSDVNGGYESRQLKLFFSYRIGNTNVKESRQRKSATAEESNRIDSQ